MATWIFQGNPKKFDVDGYLNSSSSQITWLVQRYADAIRVGDTVFLWRSKGDGDAPAGVVAELEVIEPVRIQEDDPASLPFWRAGEAEAGAAARPRVRLRIVRLAPKRGVLKRDWLKADETLKSLAILQMANQTNFPVKPREQKRLRELWDNTGRDWTRDECIAALYAYDKLLGKPVSQGPDSLVSQIAQRIGRATKGVYNKVMNFRSLDERDSRQGLDAASTMDKEVWAEFYDHGSRSINSDKLTQEYQRLWAVAEVTPLADTVRDALNAEAKRLEQRGLAALMSALSASRQAGKKPTRTRTASISFNRDALVVAITRLRASYKCEVEGCTNHGFIGAEGLPYIETHHLHMLSDGGADMPDNTAAVCAIHHRELHHGERRIALTDALKHKRSLDIYPT